jgi:hypothetical protein
VVGKFDGVNEIIDVLVIEGDKLVVVDIVPE